MENRFTFKDLILFLLLSALIVIVLLAMKQYDRQWQIMQSISADLRATSEQMAELSGQMRRLVADGLRVGGGAANNGAANSAATSGQSTASASQPVQGEQLDPFIRLRQAKQNKDFARGDWLIQVYPVNMGKLTPLVSTDAYSADMQGYVLEGLIQRDPATLEYQPLLAESWRIELPDTSAEPSTPRTHPSSPTTKRLTLTTAPSTSPSTAPSTVASEPAQPSAGPGAKIIFNLRPGATFSDGEPVLPQDVVYTFDLIMNEAIETPRARAYYQKIAWVKQTGPRQVTFQFKEPYFESLGLAGEMSILPQHFYQRFSPARINESTGLLMGSGPYRLEDPESWKPGQLLQLVRNERYWGEAPAFDRLVWREINLDQARLTTFLNGQSDVFGAQPPQYQELLKNKSLMERTQHFEYMNPSSGYNYIAWNQRTGGKPTRFADKRVRQAMTLLTDRQRIVDEILLGYAVVSTGPFNPFGKQADKQIQPWPYDPAKGMALLKEVGYTLREGVLYGPDGQPFRFKLTYPAGSPLMDRMMSMVRDGYAKAGIMMDLDTLDWAVFDDRLKNRTFDAISLGWSGSIESDIYQEFDSSQMAGTGDNFMSYSNPRLDALMRQARSEVIEAERLPLWNQCHRILHEDQPYTFLTVRKKLIFIDGRIKNVQKLARGLNPEIEWYVPRAQQRHQ